MLLNIGTSIFFLSWCPLCLSVRVPEVVSAKGTIPKKLNSVLHAVCCTSSGSNHIYLNFNSTAVVNSAVSALYWCPALTHTSVFSCLSTFLLSHPYVYSTSWQLKLRLCYYNSVLPCFLRNKSWATSQLTSCSISSAFISILVPLYKSCK